MKITWKIPTPEEFYEGHKEFEKREGRDAMYEVATFLIFHFWDNYPKMTNGLGVLLLTWNQAFYRYGRFNFDKLEECISDNSQKIISFRNRDISSLSSSDKGDIRDLFNKFLYALQIDTIRFSDKNKKRYTKDKLREVLKELEIKYEDNDDLKTLYDSIVKNHPKLEEEVINFVDTKQSNSKKKYIEITISKLRDKDKKKLESLKVIARSPVSVAKALHLLAPNFFPLWDNKIARAYGCHYKKKPAEKYIWFCKKTKTVADKVKNYNIRSNKKTLVKIIDEYNYSKYTLGWIDKESPK